MSDVSGVIDVIDLEFQDGYEIAQSEQPLSVSQS